MAEILLRIIDPKWSYDDGVQRFEQFRGTWKFDQLVGCYIYGTVDGIEVFAPPATVIPFPVHRGSAHDGVPICRATGLITD